MRVSWLIVTVTGGVWGTWFWWKTKSRWNYCVFNCRVSIACWNYMQRFLVRVCIFYLYKIKFYVSPSHSLDTHHQHSRMELKLYTSWWRLFDDDDDDDGRSFFHTFLGCVSPSPLLCLSVSVQCLPCLLPRVLFLVAVDGVSSVIVEPQLRRLLL